MKRVLIAIPAYNEEQKISNVLKPLKEKGFDILLIDDGSTDSTFHVAKEIGVKVIKHPVNLGVSEAYKTFINYGILNGYTHIVTLDGDGQHDPNLVEEYVDLLDEHEVIIGNRFHTPMDAPKEKLSSNFFASMLVNTVFNVFWPDVSCGFRAFSLRFLASIYFDSTSYGIIYQTVYECIAQGITPYYYPMKPEYTGELLQTNTKEILSLFSETDKYASGNPMLDYTILVQEKKSFHLTLNNCSFNFSLVSDNAYVISTNVYEAANYYLFNS